MRWPCLSEEKHSKPFRRESISIPVRGYVGKGNMGQLTELFKDGIEYE
jgi:hypothetical protein